MRQENKKEKGAYAKLLHNLQNMNNEENKAEITVRDDIKLYPVISIIGPVVGTMFTAAGATAAAAGLVGQALCCLVSEDYTRTSRKLTQLGLTTFVAGVVFTCSAAASIVTTPLYGAYKACKCELDEVRTPGKKLYVDEHPATVQSTGTAAAVAKEVIIDLPKLEQTGQQPPISSRANIPQPRSPLELAAVSTTTVSIRNVA